MLTYGTVFLFIILYFEMFYSKAHFNHPKSSSCPPHTHTLIVNAHRKLHIFFLLNYCSTNHSYFPRLLPFQVSLQCMWKTLLCMIFHDNSNAYCLKAVMTSYSVVSKRKLHNFSCQYAVKRKVFTLLQSTPSPQPLPLMAGFENRLRVSGCWITALCTPNPCPTLLLGYFKSVMCMFWCI